MRLRQVQPSLSCLQVGSMNPDSTSAPASGEERVLRGVAAAPGIAIGRAFILDHGSSVRESVTVSVHHVADEIARFHGALEAVLEALHRASDLAARQSTTAMAIIETYTMMVRDPTMSDSVLQRIERGVSAEAAVAQEFDMHKTALLRTQNELMRSRVQDIDTIKEQIIGALRNRTLHHAAGYDSIVVAPNVTPQDMLLFQQTQTLGYVTEVGGINSHTCILARDLNYPAVVGIGTATQLIPQDANIIVDGYSGTVVVHPTPETLEHYRQKQIRAEEYREKLGALVQKESTTTDGVRIQLLANVDEPDHVDAALMTGAEGIGLVRSETMLMHFGRYPTEDEQVAWYRDIAERMYPHPVTIRAFDVGGDKFRQGIPHHEENPALGLRGIRFLLHRSDLFEQQVLAILRASVHRNIRLLLPMISTLEEVAAARSVIAAAQQTLHRRGLPFDEQLAVGVMIETPASAMMADAFAEVADFLSIGTNDLAQYALAADRTNDMVADLYDAFHPAVLRMLVMVVESARKFHRRVSVCGELAGHAAATELLIGLGISELSVAPRLLLEVKQRVLACSHAQCAQMVRELGSCKTTSEVYHVLRTMVPTS